MREWHLRRRARITLRFVFVFILAVILFPSPYSARAQTSAKNFHEIPIINTGCNSVSFWQIWDFPDLFIGRMMNARDARRPCDADSWSLVLEQMDWSKHRLTVLDTILKTPAKIAGGLEVWSAYDPSIVNFGGEYWVAFECAFRNLKGVGASACIGPFDPHHPSRGIDLSRTYPIVFGRSALPNDPYTYSASVPKLFVYYNRLFVYWAAIKIRSAPPHTWIDITTRGMELVQQGGRGGRLWPKGASGPVASFDPAHNVEVFGIVPSDPRSNQRAEVFSVRLVDGLVYAPGVLGGSGCLNIAGKSPGCSRLSISISRQPLGYHIFNQVMVPEADLPRNPVAYVRIVRDSKNELYLMGLALRARHQDRALQSGLFIMPLPPNGLIRSFARNQLGSAR